ncbi:MAG: hypothetical protein AAF944_02190 [Bacteroidota bacterium]
MQAPIIFIHYGNSYYLKHVLRSAKMFNPKKRVILIGDSSNNRYQDIDVEHYLFEHYLDTDEVKQFEKLYRRVGGVEFEKINKNKGGEDWTKFNFLKWFVLYTFLQEQNISNLWVFDSDTIILSDLDSLEERYGETDYTVMNNNNQLQGFVSNPGYIQLFQKLCIEMFSNQEYLDQIKKKNFTVNPRHGFTMMMVFRRLSDVAKPRIRRLNKIIDNAYFDECICHQHGKEIYKKKIGHKTVKKIYCDQEGGLYQYDLTLQRYIKLLGVNLSWVPIYVFDVIYYQARKNRTYENSKQIAQSQPQEFALLDLGTPLIHSIKEKLSGIKRKILTVS